MRRVDVWPCLRFRRGVMIRLALLWSALLCCAPAVAGACCQIEGGFQMIWSGPDSLMSFHDLAAYCGPILWFFPDEPNLEGAALKDIRVPTDFWGLRLGGRNEGFWNWESMGYVVEIGAGVW